MSLPKRACLVLFALLAMVAMAAVSLRTGNVAFSGTALPHPVPELESGWKLTVVQELPEEINSLATYPEGCSETGLYVFAGTAPVGGVYKVGVVKPSVTATLRAVAVGMGDEVRFGECRVNSLAVRDLDHDGVPELLASTCQVFPLGRPRLYVWSLTSPVVSRGMARPAIDSHWGHGIGVIDRGDDGPDSIFSTFCGNGEVVEYQAARGRTETGFSSEAVSWKVVGQLPASGESTQTADADNDGRVDLCLAVGFAPHQAAVHVYDTEARGAALRLTRKIDEGGRFGNVRFLVGATRGDGLQDLFAWWCIDLGGSACEFIRYRLGPEGVRERLVIAQGRADALWPLDGQTTLADMDRDGRPEVWFATTFGNLWRYDGRLSRVLRMEGGIGPVLSCPAHDSGRPRLFFGNGPHLMRLDAA